MYEDGERDVLSEDFVSAEGNLRLFVPPSKLESIVDALESQGFRELNRKDGERILSQRLYNIWELVIIIHGDGYIDAHVEVSSDYLRESNMDVSTQYISVPSIYEVFDFYKHVYPFLHIYNSKKKKWIISVDKNYEFILKSPLSLTPWMAVSIILTAVPGVGSMAYALSRLKKVDQGEI
ncbi:hypothetical protein [Metallosphaera javensis (ex Sakai et al. 2022)]|uniref:hypothetical protein n=1 Tax=Metallosphaera javensis (ex Sakai et al. 2022) TaxID=2775498 RepID=UPI0025908F63|nr:MAG: hypothetical protein MjAS7_1636 [Metallosphaera javensis (ex Sakai et al. 2022)]